MPLAALTLLALPYLPWLGDACRWSSALAGPLGLWLWTVVVVVSVWALAAGLPPRARERATRRGALVGRRRHGADPWRGRVSAGAGRAVPGRRRAALPRRHAERADRSRPAHRRQPRARRLPRVLPWRAQARPHRAARPRRRHLLDSSHRRLAAGRAGLCAWRLSRGQPDHRVVRRDRGMAVVAVAARAHGIGRRRHLDGWPSSPARRSCCTGLPCTRRSPRRWPCWSRWPGVQAPPTRAATSVVRGLALGALPWLGTKYAPMALVIGVLLAVRAPKDRARLVAIAAPAAVLVCAWLGMVCVAVGHAVADGALRRRAPDGAVAPGGGIAGTLLRSGVRHRRGRAGAGDGVGGLVAALAARCRRAHAGRRDAAAAADAGADRRRVCDVVGRIGAAGAATGRRAAAAGRAAGRAVARAGDRLPRVVRCWSSCSAWASPRPERWSFAREGLLIANDRDGTSELLGYLAPGNALTRIMPSFTADRTALTWPLALLLVWAASWRRSGGSRVALRAALPGRAGLDRYRVPARSPS